MLFAILATDYDWQIAEKTVTNCFGSVQCKQMRYLYNIVKCIFVIPQDQGILGIVSKQDRNGYKFITKTIS